MQFLRDLFSSGEFMPHIHCYLYTPGLVWLHVLSDMLIGLSYVAISITLVYLVYRGRRDIPFHSMFLAFGLFIVACGATHFMEVWTLWHAHYWVSGGVKAVTAAASVATAVALPPLVPLILNLVRDARISEARRIELEEAHSELNAVYLRLKEFDELKSQVFANVSHELRTPLTLIVGPTERMLAARDTPDAMRRDLEVVRSNSRLLLKHVNDLLDLSRGQAGRTDLEYARADLARLARAAAGLFEAHAREREIRFDVEAPAALPAEMDPDRVERIVLNLLSNAFKFTPAGGVVRLVLSEEPDEGRRQARLEVHDSGPGVPRELREVIFEPFRQAEGGATRHFGGTGLGLAIVREFVQAHAGDVSVRESPDGGALFVVRLPLEARPGAYVREAEDEGAAPDETAAALLQELRRDEIAEARLSDAEAGEDRPLVLVVEDNSEMRAFTVAVLRDEYRVAAAADGQEGLERALTLRPDLVLSDVMMPRMSGDQLVREIRSHRQLDDVPVILLTAKADQELRLRMLREGAQDYVMKPFRAEELRARVRNLISMKRARDLLQEELSTRMDDLGQLAGEVAARKRELQGSLEAVQMALAHAERGSQVKTTFLRMVSHELRTPLTTLQIQLGRLARDRETPLTPRQEEILRKLNAAYTRLAELVESLLEHARIESGNLAARREAVDLAELARNVVEEMKPLAEQQGLNLGLTTTGPVPPLASDPRLVRLILVNLVGNAVKFTTEGTVEVTVDHGAEGHRLAVRDTGPGIPGDLWDTIFEPFEQLERVERKHTPGVGLGLALVKEMTEALGGRIEVASTVGMGSTFTVILPPPDAGAVEEEADSTE